MRPDQTHRTLPALTIALGLLLASAALTGCIADTARAGTGTLYVKDAPTDELSAVHVTFTKAQVRANGSAVWTTVFEGERTIELLSLRASTAKEGLADLSLPEGEYDELRIAVGHVRIVDKNGAERSLNVTGNVVTIGEDFRIDAEEALDMVVDFDLDSGIDLENATYTPRVKDVQRSSDDADGDGIHDVDDADDDNDGVEDADDDDRDGDGKDDADEIEQAHDDEEDLDDDSDDGAEDDDTPRASASAEANASPDTDERTVGGDARTGGAQADESADEDPSSNTTRDNTTDS